MAAMHKSLKLSQEDDTSSPRAAWSPMAHQQMPGQPQEAPVLTMGSHSSVKATGCGFAPEDGKSAASQETPAEITVHETCGSTCTPTCVDMGSAGSANVRRRGVRSFSELPRVSPDVKWQWEHRTGFRCYTESEMRRIEFAFNRGDSKVRLKTGKQARTPMEIFFVEMIQYDPLSKNTRKVRRLGPDRCRSRIWRYMKQEYRAWLLGRPRQESFEAYQARRKAIVAGEGLKQDLNINHERFLYRDAGCAPAIAKHAAFAWIVNAAVLLSAIWISVDLDNNTDPNNDWPFIVVENMFCFVFAVELVIRFCALKKKRNCFLDAWLRFDTALVIVTVSETWVAPLVLLMAGGDLNDGDKFSNLGILRLARLLRLTRMTKLIRTMPEVMTLLMGIVSAFRSVSCTMLLLIVLLYVFAVVFRTVTQDTDVGRDDFHSVEASMWALLLHGTFLDNVAELVEKIGDDCGRLGTYLFLIFVFLSCFTVLNMLVGILCEIIAEVKREREADFESAYLRNALLDIMECYDADGDRSLAKDEFDVMMTNPEVIGAITRFGTEVDGLVTLSEVLFACDTESSATGKLSFEEFLAVVVRLRGHHTASVTDVVELREYTKKELIKGIARIQSGQQQVLDRIGDLERVQAQDKRLDAEPIVVVQATLAGKTRNHRHTAATTVGQFLAQFSSRYGSLAATDASGVIVGAELTLGRLAAASDGALALNLEPAVWSDAR